MRFVLCFCMIFFVSIGQGQILSSKDLSLKIVGRNIKDTAITVEELSKIEKIEGNYPWIIVNEITVVLAGICLNATGVNSRTCLGNVICGRAKDLLSYVRHSGSGAIVIIESHNSTNKSGNKLAVSPLFLRVK